MFNSVELNSIARFRRRERLEELSTCNLIFGANGTGKSTIVRYLQNTLATDQPDEFENCNYDGSIEPSTKIAVFNNELQERMFQNPSALNGIHTTTANQDKQNQIASLLAQLKALESEIENTISKKAAEEEEFQRKFELTANLVRDAFEPIKNSPLKQLFQGHVQKKLLTEHLLNASQDLPGSSESLNQLETQFHNLNADQNQQIALPPRMSNTPTDLFRVKKLCNEPILPSDESPLSDFIQKAGNVHWVQHGSRFLDHTDGHCPMCQQELPSKFRDQLAAYFDETYQNSITELQRHAKVNNSHIHEVESYLNSIKGTYVGDDCEVYLDAIEQHLENLKLITAAIHEKLRDLGESVSIPDIQPSQEQLNSSFLVFLNSVQRLIEARNDRKKSLEDLKLRSDAYLFDSLGPSFSLQIQELLDLKDNIESNLAKIQDAEARAKDLKTEKLELENDLSSIGPSVQFINRLLKSYGFDTFALQIASDGASYKIIRKDGSDTASMLSEGEKTFLSFLHYYESLYGNEFKSNPTICVIDDPVSSLDSQSLSIIANLTSDLLKKAGRNNNEVSIMQIFVFTHSAYFFDDICPKYRDRNNSDKRYRYYTIFKNDARSSKVDTFRTNPIESPYSLIWREVFTKSSNFHLKANGLRRILEYYFQFTAGVHLGELSAKLEKEDRLIAETLIASLHHDSHKINDGILQSGLESNFQQQLRAFKKIFYANGHEAHFELMYARASKGLGEEFDSQGLNSGADEDLHR